MSFDEWITKKYLLFRAFAIESLRNGADLVTLMRLMGHTSTAVLRRYLNLVESDLARVHAESSPADNLE